MMIHIQSPTASPRRAFTLLELLAATLLGSIVILMIAGSLRSGVRSWESVQESVGDNYNRRMVLDLIKRQTSSLFFRSDFDELNSAGGVNPEPQNPRAALRDRQARTRETRSPLNQARDPLPDGASFFKGNIQEFSFLSTTSFLSDFPGQVAVRYFVVQEDPQSIENEADISGLPSSRTDGGFGFDDGGIDDAVAPEMTGNLYLYVEETNLFLSAIGVESGDPFDSGEVLSGNGLPAGGRLTGSGTGQSTMSEAVSTQAMRLLGPLRKFTIRYRQPAMREADEADEADDWSETWNVDNAGVYPTAVEFIMFYEKPGITDNVPDEELPGIRMVLPVYDSRNLARRNPRGPF